VRAVQVLPEFSRGDAIGNDARAIRDILREAGYDTMIYTLKADPRLPAEEWRDIREMPAPEGQDILIYHASVGSELNYTLPSYGGKKVMVYHNITPASFYGHYSPQAVNVSRAGYAGIRYLADKMDYCIAVSEYNKQELRKMGYTCPIDVCPILIPFSDYDKAPDEAFLQKYRDGKKNWLFVGRVVPNKKPEDVIRAFAVYHRGYEPESRLLLIGSTGNVKLYDRALENYIRALELEDAVVMPGHVTFAEILAGYHAADVFVCMSEHEGFCVPLVEAMYFGVPIVTYASSAIPETLGKGGLLLSEKSPETAAAAVNRVLTDERLRDALVKAGKERLKDFSYEAVKKQFLACLEKVIAE